MARPRKGSQKYRPKHLGFRVATWVYDGVQRLAAEHGQPASDIAHELLEIALGRFGIKLETTTPPTPPMHPQGAQAGGLGVQADRGT